MPDRELRFYKRWCYTLAFVLFFTVIGSAYAYDHKHIDAACRNIEFKYQYLLNHGEDLTPEEQVEEGPDAHD